MNWTGLCIHISLCARVYVCVCVCVCVCECFDGVIFSLSVALQVGLCAETTTVSVRMQLPMFR